MLFLLWCVLQQVVDLGPESLNSCNVWIQFCLTQWIVLHSSTAPNLVIAWNNNRNADLLCLISPHQIFSLSYYVLVFRKMSPVTLGVFPLVLKKCGRGRLQMKSVLCQYSLKQSLQNSWSMICESKSSSSHPTTFKKYCFMIQVGRVLNKNVILRDTWEVM